MGRRFSELSVITDVGDNVLLSGVDPDDTSYSVDGTNKIFSKANLLKEAIDAIESGWNESPQTFTFASVDDPTGVITCTGANTFLSVGMRVKFDNGGNTIYGIITVVTSTTFTFLHEMNTNGNGAAVNLMANSAITNPSYSTQKAPFGFPTNSESWSKEHDYTTTVTEGISIDTSTAGWKDSGLDFDNVPVGEWVFAVNIPVEAQDPATSGRGNCQAKLTLSTTTDSETDKRFTEFFGILAERSNLGVRSRQCWKPSVRISLASKTSFNILAIRATSETAAVALPINFTQIGYIRATCAYL